MRKSWVFCSEALKGLMRPHGPHPLNADSVRRWAKVWLGCALLFQNSFYDWLTGNIDFGFVLVNLSWHHINFLSSIMNWCLSCLFLWKVSVWESWKQHNALMPMLVTWQEGRVRPYGLIPSIFRPENSLAWMVGLLVFFRRVIQV